MCLSTIYLASDSERQNPLAKNVTSVDIEDGRIAYSDLLGMKSFLDGRIMHVDLIKNYIVIDSDN